MENELNINSTNGNSFEDVSVLKQRLECFERREKEWAKEKEEMESEFGMKRAKLKDLYLQKEDELEKERATSSTMRTGKQDLEEEFLRLQQELNEYKSQVAMAWDMADQAETEKKKSEEKLASMEQIMEETMNESSSNSSKYEKELQRLMKLNEKLDVENQELRSQTDKEGVLSVMTKTLAKRVVSLNAHSQSNENIHENLEDSMKKHQNTSAGNGWWAQEDAEMLRSLVVPLEEEIRALKDKLRAADDQLRIYETTQANLISGSVMALLRGRTPAEVVSELDERLKEVNEDLKAEKSSRSDLEMYVAVLQTQKTVLQEDSDKVRKELQEVCRLLEIEKREHNDLKQTWQMANDQFLEVQRLHIMDMRRMQSLLTMEQQRMLAEMQKRDDERLEQERRVQRCFQIREEQEKLKQADANKDKLPGSPILARLSLRRRKSPSPSQCDLTDSGNSTDASSSIREFVVVNKPKFDSVVPSTNDLIESEISIVAPSSPLVVSDFAEPNPSAIVPRLDKLDGLSSLESSGEHSFEHSLDGQELSQKIGDNIPNLTEAQFKALADLTPEQEERQQLLESARSRPESLLISTGKRLVSEKEWHLLQEELKKARNKMNRTCDMCSNYEAQLQKVQEHEKDMERQVQVLEKALASCKEELMQEQKFKKELEEQVEKLSVDQQKQVSELTKRLDEAIQRHQVLYNQYKALTGDLSAQVKSLSANREEVQAEISRLQKENDSLVGKHSAHAQQMQNERIELPTDPDEMLHVLLKTREDLIAAKVAKEQTEETLKSEILFLKDHVMAEQHAKTRMEDSLTQEIDTLRSQLGILSSIESQLQEEQARRLEVEQQAKDLHQWQAGSKQVVGGLQKHIDELKDTKSKLEEEIHKLKCKVQSLQQDLDTSEVVQRDFVKLSQNLQVQLEKIRGSETEVRWQHEEDIEDCANCKQPFAGSNRKKHHCHHCGKIFCSDCLSKSVPSGPQRKPSRVCDVCHTLLVSNTAPYFSKEPPHTPD